MVFYKFKAGDFLKVIILAGGGGSRLFSLSRKSFPKQFLKNGTYIGEDDIKYL